MSKINSKYFESWIVNSLSQNSSRHLFFDFNERLIAEVEKLYNANGSLSFLSSSNLWVFTQEASDINFKVNDCVSRICDSDLIEMRNTSEDISFVVLISNSAPVIIPSDNITSVSEKYYDSQRKFIEYICTEVFIGEFNLEKKRIYEYRDYLFSECSDYLDFCFYKEIINQNVFDFFGLIGEERHFKSHLFKDSKYIKDFIRRVQLVLEAESYIGLEKRLELHQVSNYKETLTEFKKEGFISAKEFSRNICNVFLRDTSKYRELIDVDEWISALKELLEEDSIKYDAKDSRDAFSIVKVANVQSDKRSYIIGVDFLQVYLKTLRESIWSIDRNEKGNFIHLDVLQKDSLINIVSKINEEKKSISIVNYSHLISDVNKLDYGIRVRERFSLNKDFKISIIKDKKILKEVEKSLNNILINAYDGSIGPKSAKEFEELSLLEVKDKILFANSDLDFSLRLVDKECRIDLILLEDENSELKIWNDNTQQIDLRVVISNFDFKDIELFLQNISANRLYIRICNDQKFEWIVVQFSPLGSKEPVTVKNFFQKYQALNDSTLKDRVVSIASKSKNDIHSYYFEDKFNFDSTYLPTIFNFDDDYSFINVSSSNPYFLDIGKFRLDTDFRPSRQDFDDLMNISDFVDYIEIRGLISVWYRSKFEAYDIRSIDDIDFSSDEIFNLSLNYLELYNKLLQLNPIFSWLDTFYFCKNIISFARLDNMPFAVFLSPFNPLLLYQLTSKMRLMRNTVEGIKKPNSLASLLKRNILECWVLDVPSHKECFFSIETDSTLFTGFVSERDLYENTLEPTLKRFNVSFSQGIGHLSSSQIKSALNKSYSYLSNKSTFNVKLEGELVDDSANDAILEWVELKTIELNNLYSNFNLQINIFDCRDSLCYPSDNLLSYYKDEKSLNFNWYKGISEITTFDLTLITSFIPDTSTYKQTSSDNFSGSFLYKNLISAGLTIYYNNAVYRDLFFKNSFKGDMLNESLLLLNDQFKNNLSVNQTRTLLKNSSFKDSEVVAISSDISNSYVLEEVLGKTLWEFSISDYSYKDSGKGDYFLIANEQEVYVSNFRRFLEEIDPDSAVIYQDILNYSKRIGLFELKHLISNQNFIKGFIAAVSARKVIDNVIVNSSDTFIVPYDVFWSRLQKIKLEVVPDFQEAGTQFPDFILVQVSRENEGWIIDIRLIEIKYRNILLGEDDISKILSNQTSSVRNVFCILNSWRNESVLEYGLWVDTLSMLLCEMSQFYFNNTLNLNPELKINFAEAINGVYTCRINAPLLIALDSSDSINSGIVESGVFIKIPRVQLHVIFQENESVNKQFKSFFDTLVRTDSCQAVQKRLDENDSDFELEDLSDGDLPIVDVLTEASGNLEKPLAKILEDSDDIVDCNNSNKSLVLFGRDRSCRDVIYYPKGKGSSPLPNYNIMVTGSSGKGKTQFIKSFIFQQERKGSTFTIVDFKNDYSDNEFCEISKLKKISVKLQGIPYNPLIPRLVTDEDSGMKYYDVSEHINAICSVLKSTFGLGDQQEAQLKKAVREVYRLSGLDTKGTLVYKSGMTFPSFNEVGDYINSGDKDLIKLYNRLDPLFDLNLFPDDFRNIGFENVINESYVIKVADIQNDQIKNAIAKLILVSAHGYYLGSEHRTNVSKYFVFDEAHRILDTEFVEKFIRECRAFGVGVLLSSQQPDDFPDEVLGQLATKVIHGNEGVAKLTKKIKSLISFEGDDHLINNLKTFEAIVNNQDYKNYIIQTLAWPHLMVLFSLKFFDNGVNLNELMTLVSSKGVKVSELPNLLNSLEGKGYIKNENGIYRICSDVF